MTAGRNIEINHDVDWIQDEDDNVIGYQRDPKTQVAIATWTDSTYSALRTPAGGSVAVGGGVSVPALTQLLSNGTPLKVSWIGNSLIANGGRMIDRLGVLSGGRLVTVRNAGRAGADLTQIISFMAVDIDPTADIVFVGEGSNGAVTNVGTGTEYSQMVTVANYIKSLGKVCVICASPPRNPDAATLKRTNRYPFSERLAALDTGSIFVDPWYDWRGTNGGYGFSFSDDATHPAVPKYYLYTLAASRIWEALNPYFYGGVRKPFMEVLSDGDNAGFSGSGQSARFIPEGNALFLNGTTGWTNGDATKVTLSTSGAAPFRGNKMVMTSGGVSGTPVVISRTYMNSVPGAPFPAVNDVVEARAVVGVENPINLSVAVTLYSSNNFAEKTLVTNSGGPVPEEMFSTTQAWSAASGQPMEIRITLSKARTITLTATGSGTNLTVSAISAGVVELGCTIAGTGIPAGTKIVSQTSGTQGVAGVYVTDQATTGTASAVEVLGTGIVTLSNADVYNLTKLRTTTYGYA